MIDLKDTVRLLQANREELLDQLDALDAALAALSRVGLAATTAREGNPQETTEKAPSAVLPTKLKPRRSLSDEHKHALKEGRRKARQQKDAAEGHAREMPDPSPGLAPASSANGRRPRLVKQTRRVQS